jgi:membrane protease subunit HflK
MSNGWSRDGGPVIDLPKNFPKQLPVSGIVIGVLALFGIWFLFTSFFQVAQDEVGVILRFGKYVRTVEPGLRFKLPLGIETVRKVPVERQLKLEFGYRTELAGQRTQYSSSDFSEEAMMLTGDLNVAVVEWSVQYRIHDPRAYLFNVRNPEATFRDVSEAVMRTVVGDHSVDEVVTSGRDEVAVAAQTMLQELLDRYEMGISILQLVPQDVNPPDPVKPAFNEVNQAIQEKETLENEAEADYNRAIPLAEGQAAQRISEAEGYAEQRVNQAKGDAARFESVLAEYRRAPGVTRQRLWQETLQEVIAHSGNRVVVDRDLQGLVPLLNLGDGLSPAAPPQKSKEDGR